MKIRPFLIITIIALIVIVSSAFIWNRNTSAIHANAVTFDQLKMRFQLSKTPSFEVSEELFIDREKADKTAWVHGNNQTIGYEFQVFLPFITKSHAFSRMPEYFAPVQMLENDKYYAFIYRHTRGFRDLAYDQFYVSVLDKNGNSIHHEDITEERTNDEVIAFKIDSDFQLKKRIFVRKSNEDINDTNPNKYTLAFKSKITIDLKTIKPAAVQEEEGGFLQRRKLPKKITQSNTIDRAK